MSEGSIELTVTELLNCSEADLVVKLIENAFLKHPQEIITSIHEGQAPRTTALFLMLNASFDLLLSGRFHVYRGVLSPSGNDLYASWERIARLIIEFDPIKSEEVSESRQYLHETILEIG